LVEELMIPIRSINELLAVILPHVPSKACERRIAEHAFSVVNKEGAYSVTVTGIAGEWKFVVVPNVKTLQYDVQVFIKERYGQASRPRGVAVQGQRHSKSPRRIRPKRDANDRA
jgi:hypothetical protein